MNVISTIIAALSFTFCLVVPLFVCDCGPEPSVDQLTKRADVVFLGEVVEGAKGKKPSDAKTVKFRVTKIWKGSRAKSYIFHEWSNSCMVGFRQGEFYLVYALLGKQEQIFTNACYGTRLLSQASEHLKQLGEGKEPE